MNPNDERDVRRIGTDCCRWCGRAGEGPCCPDCETGVRESQAKWQQDESEQESGW